MRAKTEKRHKIYALYKGDTYITGGTIIELAEFRGVKESSIRFYKSNVYKKRTKRGNGLRLIELEDEDA